MGEIDTISNNKQAKHQTKLGKFIDAIIEYH